MIEKLIDCLPSNSGPIRLDIDELGNYCLNGATTTRDHYLMATSTTGDNGLVSTTVDTLMTGVFFFVRFILPYAIVIGLLIIGLAIAWRVFRGVGKV